MKGFQTKTTGDGLFFTIKHNSIVRESKEPREGFQPIKVQNPRTKEEITKYIEKYDLLEAIIYKIEWYDTEQRYDTRYRGWKIHLDANGKKGVLDLPFDTRVSSRFMKLAENIDYTKPVEFRAWKDTRSDSTALFVGQDGKNVPQKYTRDEPGDLPPPIQKASGKWNYDDQADFLHERMIKHVIPLVAKLHPVEEAEKKTDEPEEEFSEPEGDLADTLKSIQGIIKAAAGTKEVKGATKSQLLEQYFGTANWAEVEKMPEDVLKAALKKMDDLLPF